MQKGSQHIVKRSTRKQSQRLGTLSVVLRNDAVAPSLCENVQHQGCCTKHSPPPKKNFKSQTPCVLVFKLTVHGKGKVSQSEAVGLIDSYRHNSQTELSSSQPRDQELRLLQDMGSLPVAVCVTSLSV